MSTRASALFIYITVALDAVGFGIVVPVVPDMVKWIGHMPASDTSFWVGLLLAAFAAMQFLAAPVLGGLSDRFGRRPVLLTSLAGVGLLSLATAAAPNLLVLLAVRMAAGAMSGNEAAAEACIADITPAEQRAARFGMIGALYGIAFVLGPAAGGLLGRVDVRLPFVASAVLAACNLAYGCLLLPESLPADRRRDFDWRRANPFGTLRGAFAGRSAIVLAGAWCCLWFALGAQQSSFILANEMRFGWNTVQNGLVLALAGSVSALTQGVLVQRCTARLGEKPTALLGLGFSTIGYLCYAFAFSRFVMFPGVVILALGALANPAIQAMATSRAGRDAQGEVQGGLTALQGLMAVVAPLSTGWLFTVATRPGHAIHFAGAPFLVAAIACAGGLLGLLLLPRNADQD